MKRRYSRRNDALLRRIISVDLKCNAILASLGLLRKHTSGYPQNFVESVNNLHKATMELDKLRKRKEGEW